jgi:release factor glutamine methyltransferase
LANAIPSASVVAVDASPDALRIARANAIAHRLADRIRFVEGRGFDALKHRNGDHPLPDRFDAVVTNPPYIPSAEIGSLQPEVQHHEPRLALDGGLDGLDCFRELAAQAQSWLKPGGLLLAEFGDGQAPALGELFGRHGWTSVSVEKDLSGRERILIVASPRA